MRAPTQGLPLISRSNSTLSQSPQHRSTRRSTRTYSRMSLTAAAAVAAGVLGAAGVLADTAPQTGAMSNVTETVLTGHETSTAQAGTSIFDSVIGVESRLAAAQPWQPQPQTGWVQLGSRAGNIPVPGTLSTSALPHGASTNRSTAAAGHSAQHAAHTPLTAAPASGSESPAARTNAARSQVARTGAAQAQTAQAHATQAHARQAGPAAVHAVRRPRLVQTRVAPAQPYLIYDSVTPTAIPGNQRIATYVNGTYAASAGQVAGRGRVLWIDTNGSDPAASALDVEPGDATPAGAAQWIDQKLKAAPQSQAIIYTMLSEWQAVKDNVAALPSWMQSRVRYWIADPTGVPHVVPGANATQWYWGNSYDITTANPGFQTP